MADEIITVEWIATAQSMLTTIEKIDQKIERQEKLMQKLADTSKKGAVEAAGSFNRLEQELKENEAALKKLAIGSKEFDEQRRKVDALRQSMARAKGELTGMASASNTFGDMKTALLGGVAAAGTLVAALHKVAEAQRDIVNTGSDAGLALDTMARKFQIQADLNDQQRGEAAKAIIEQSSAVGVKAEAGFQTATALASTGFKDPLKTGTLKIALEGQQGTSFTGSPEQYVESTAQALSAYGLDKTAANLAMINTRLAGIFKETAVQAVDLTDFAKNASVLEKRMGIGEGLAGFAALREKGTAESASMGMRQVTLGMMAPDTTGVKGMKALGLKPEQLDMVGESFSDAIATLKTAVDKLPKEQQAPALNKMFGAQGIAAAMNVMQALPRIKELEGVQNNPAALAANVETAKASMQSGRNRRENQELLGLAPIAGQLEDQRAKMDQRDANLRAIERQASVQLGAPAAAVMRMGGAVTSTIDDSTGADITGGALRGESMTSSFGMALGKWFMNAEKKQDELIALQREANALAAGNRPVNRPAPPARGVRPGEAPLPGAQVP